jgi:hypothetical protein
MVLVLLALLLILMMFFVLIKMIFSMMGRKIVGYKQINNPTTQTKSNKQGFYFVRGLVD